MQTGYATFGNELLQTRGGPYISLDDVLQHLLVERQICDDALEPRVLFFELL